MAKKDKEIKNKNKGMTEIEAFNADLELERYRRRIERGELTEEEKQDRKEFLEFLGFSDEI